MATRAEAVDLLINKGKFEPQVALAVAEAIAVTTTESQVVTVPILDVRLAETTARLEKSIATTNQATIERLERSIAASADRLEASIAATNQSTIDRLERLIVATKDGLEQSIAGTKEVLTQSITEKTDALAQSIAATKGGLEQSIAATKDALTQSITEKTDGLAQSIAETRDSVAKSIAETNLTTIAKVEKVVADTKAELVRWVLLALLGCVALQGATVAFFNALLHH